MPVKKTRVFEKEIGTNYLVDKLIGEGGFCVVLKATDKTTKRQVAIKRMDKGKPLYEKFQSPKAIERLNKLMYREADCLRNLEHENIIALLDFIDDGKHIYIILELAEGGELYSRLMRAGRFQENYVVHIMKQLISALIFMHNKNYVHRDIKAENILFKDRNATVIVLTDFGLSKESEGYLYTNCGTLVYSAPELLRNKEKREGYDKSVDVWAVGVLCYLMLCGYLPFDDIHHREFRIVCMIMNGKVKFMYSQWRQVSDDAKEFITQLLVVNPMKRMGLETAVSHSFLSQSCNINKNTVPNRNTPTGAVNPIEQLEIFPMMEASLQQALARTRWKVIIYFSITFSRFHALAVEKGQTNISQKQ